MTGLAHADTGPWAWSDMSDKLSERANRPVWVVVRAEPHWYMTDGQELWSGGHVWKTDGSTVSDITVDVRNAGISRVDDMVSDGQTVLFLKNVTRQDNQFEAVSYNGSFTNRTNLLRGNLSSSEGMTSINGKGGIWMIVTTQNRVLSWNMGSNTLTQISLPITPVNNGYQTYAIRHNSPNDGQSVLSATQVVPTSGGWLFAITQGSLPNVRLYYYQNGSFNELSVNTLASLTFIASNGNQVLLNGNHVVGGYTQGNIGMQVVEGNSIKSAYTYVSNAPFIDWTKATASHNGKSWMILSGKNLLRFDGTNFQTYGQTNDLLLTLSGNGSGTFLLGGALSTSGNTGPSVPLTAKLIRVDEGTGYVAPTTGTTGNSVASDETITTAAGSKNRITYRAFFDPKWALHDNITDPKYTVVGQSYDGLRRIEMYINGVRQRVCDGKDSKGNVTCTMFIESTGYNYDADQAVNAKLTSTKGAVTWVPVRAIQFHNGTVDHSSSVTGNDGPVTANMTVSNSAHTLTRGTNVTINATANAPAGLNRMELYVNGSLKSTCSISGTYNTCNFNLSTDYPSGSAIAFNVRAVDVNGRDGWTWLGSYSITDQYVTTNTTGDVTGSMYVDSWTGSGSTGSAYIKVQGSSPIGLNRIDTYANGSLYRTCTFSQAYGTQTCAFSVWASSFSNYNSVSTYSVITDSNGRQFTTNTLNLNFGSNTSNGGTTYTGNSTNGLTVWFAADIANNSSLRRDLSKTVTVYGNSTNGLRKLDIYANNNLVQSCTFSDIVNSQQSCQTTVYGSNYSEGTSVYLNARATDRYGYTSWTSNLYMTITSSGTGNTGNTNVYFTVSPDDNNWNRTNNKTVTAYGSDSDGLRRLEIYMKGGLYKTCDFSDVYDTQSCSVTLYGTDNAVGSNIEINARATDRHGNVSWATAKSYLMTNGENQNGSSSLTISPSKSTYTNTDTVTANVTAWDNDNVKRIDIYANGTIVNSCVAPSWSTNYTCSSSIYLNNYLAGLTQLPIQAKVTDTYDNVSWTNTSYLQISGTTNNNGTSQSSSLSPSKTTYMNTEMPTFSVLAADNDGIKSIQLYKNGADWKYCTGNNQTQLTCTETANFDSYTNGASVTFQGKILDVNNNETWTSVTSVTIQNTSQPSNTDQPGSITVTTNAAGGYTADQRVTFTANGSDANGIGYIEILVNAKIVQTCSGVGTCSYTAGQFTGNTVSYGANLYDSLGNRTWTGYQTISKK